MIAFDAAARRKVRWAAKHQIELLVRPERVIRSEVREPNFVSRVQTVIGRRFSSEANALLLRFDRNDARPRQPPGSDHPDGSDAGTEVENPRRTRRPRRPVPRRQHIVGGEPMAIAKLKDAEVTADGVECFAGPYLRSRIGAWRNDARLHPTLEMRFDLLAET
jgi:hypothetical protein